LTSTDKARRPGGCGRTPVRPLRLILHFTIAHSHRTHPGYRNFVQLTPARFCCYGCAVDRPKHLGAVAPGGAWHGLLRAVTGVNVHATSRHFLSAVEPRPESMRPENRVSKSPDFRSFSCPFPVVFPSFSCRFPVVLRTKTNVQRRFPVVSPSFCVAKLDVCVMKFGNGDRIQSTDRFSGCRVLAPRRRSRRGNLYAAAPADTFVSARRTPIRRSTTDASAKPAEKLHVTCTA
jgi:hypothetical protein